MLVIHRLSQAAFPPELGPVCSAIYAASHAQNATAQTPRTPGQHTGHNAAWVIALGTCGVKRRITILWGCLPVQDMAACSINQGHVCACFHVRSL
jgi:hypothetical protein